MSDLDWLEVFLCGCGKPTRYVKMVDGKQVHSCNKDKRCEKTIPNKALQEIEESKAEIERLKAELNQAKRDRDEAYDDAKHVIEQMRKEIDFHVNEYKLLEFRYEMLLEGASKLVENNMSPVTIIWKQEDKND